MSGLDGQLVAYLRVRRSLGHQLTGAEFLLRQFLAWLDQAGATVITTDLALAWAVAPGASQVYHAQRLSAVRGFAAWLHAADPATQVPPAGLLTARPARSLPYLYRPAEVTAIINAAGRLRRPATQLAYATPTGLLASTGLRVSEAIGLQRGDVTDGLVRVTRSKFGKPRKVPLHPTAAAALEEYARRRDERSPAGGQQPSWSARPGRRWSTARCCGFSADCWTWQACTPGPASPSRGSTRCAIPSRSRR